MKQSWGWICVLVLLLGLSSMACALTAGEESEPPQTAAEPSGENAEVGAGQDVSAAEATEVVRTITSTPEPAPTDTPEPITTATEQAAPRTLDFSPEESGLNQLNSYRMELSMTFEGETEAGSAVSGGVRGLIRFSSVPAANSVDLSIYGDSELGDQEISFAQLEDKVYASLGGLGCIAGAITELGPVLEGIDEIADPEQLFQELENASFAGVESYDGVESECYIFDESSLARSDSDFETLEGRICIATQEDYVTFLRIEGVGSNSEFGMGGEDATGVTVIEMSVRDANQPLEIAIPEECQDIEAEYPLMEDATGVSQLEGLFAYNTASSFEEVVAFYQEEMVAAGYVAEGEAMIIAESNQASLTFRKDGSSVTVTIMPTTEGAGLQVFIITE